MCAEEILKTMLRSFFVIATGIVASMYVFCLIFSPDARFTLNDIGNILLMACAGDIPTVVFLSRKELSKRQLAIRVAIHLVVLSSILLFLAIQWNWVVWNDARQIVVFLLSVLFVYGVVFATTYYRDRKLADELNNSLHERYRSK